MGRDMSRSIHRLNTLAVTRASARGYYPDGGGLYLRVSTSGTKSWVYRYTTAGCTHDVGLGSANDFTLAEARERARECRQQRARGADPLGERRAAEAEEKLEAVKVISFKECAEKYMAAHEAGWKNPKHAAQWHSTLENYAYPILGDLTVSEIDTTLVMKVLEQEIEPGVTLWASRPETASRLRGRIEAVLDWAKARGYRSGENPARWKGHLSNLLASRKRLRSIQHHPALPYDELPAFIEKLRNESGTPSRALELVILTAVRTSELLGARWSEIDLDAKVWTIPAERMKGRREGEREHRVPLSPRAIEILGALPREGELVFPGERAGRPLSNMAMLKVLARMGHDNVTVHGFRSTFRDWAAERTNFPNHVVEMALAHVVADKVEAAYRRGELFEKRRRLMDAWASYAGSPVKGQVIELKRGHG